MYKICIFTLTVAFWLTVPVAAYAACNASISTTKPDSIYTDHGDGTVTDNETGLMWKQCSEGLSSTATPCDTGFIETYTWQMALQHVEAINTGGGFAGYTDWRLPNQKELASLVELQCYDPAINTNLFPNTLSSLGPGLVKYYRVSSPYFPRSSTPSDGGYSRAVIFYSGVGIVTGKSGTHFVRLVRGGL